jgi:hypothetical protein
MGIAARRSSARAGPVAGGFFSRPAMGIATRRFFARCLLKKRRAGRVAGDFCYAEDLGVCRHPADFSLCRQTCCSRPKKMV